MATLIAEDLLLLLLDDESGKLTNATFLDAGLGGALLVELALGEHVEVVTGGGLWARAKVRPTVAAAPSDPVLAEALALVAEKERDRPGPRGSPGQEAPRAVARASRARRDPPAQDDRVLGVIPRRRWPAVDGAHETDVRRRLGDALLRGITPEERTAALIAVLSSMDLAHKVVDPDGLPRRQVKARAKEVADGDWAAKA